MSEKSHESLGGEVTFSGRSLRGLASGFSLGDEGTVAPDGVSNTPAAIRDMEVVDLEARYKPERPLGQGGMGAVLLANDTRLGRRVAVKRILGESAANPTAVTRFLAEAKAIASLNHPNVVQIYDYGRAKDGPFLIMEYVDGGSLLDRCREGAIPLAEAIDLACQLCDGLATAHDQGIIHRDIKPANVLLTKDGVPKLTDFGLAKAQSADFGQTVSGAVLGTPDFMPPEQQRGVGEVDVRSDLWSLAATVYQMVTGKSPKVINLSNVALPLQAVLAKGLEDDKDRRYQSATELRNALSDAVGVESEKDSLRPGTLSEGQCPQCGMINGDTARKFCRNCGEGLRTHCLQCDADMPVWDAICGECGGDQSSVEEKRKADLVSQCKQARDAYKQLDLSTARALGESLASLKHPRLAKFAEWGQAFLRSVDDQRKKLAAVAAERFAEAQAHRKAFDYAAAIRAIESLPVSSRSPAMEACLAECHANSREAKRLLPMIADRINRKDLDGLLPQVERAVELQGQRADLRNLLERLKARESTQQRLRAQAATAIPGHPEPLPGTSPQVRKAVEPAATPLTRTLGFGSSLRRTALSMGFIAATLLLSLTGWLIYRSASVSRRPVIATAEPPGVPAVSVQATDTVPTPAVTQTATAQAGASTGGESSAGRPLSASSGDPVSIGVLYQSLPASNAQSLGVAAGSLVVAAIAPGGPAHKGGLAIGDVLLAFDGKRVAHADDLNALAIKSMAEGSEHALSVSRRGKELTIGVTLSRVSGTWSIGQPDLHELSRINLNGNADGIRYAGSRMCCATSAGVGVWSPAEEGTPLVFRAKGTHVDLSADGKTAVVGEKHGRLVVWDAIPGKEQAVLVENGDEQLTSCCIDAAATRVAALDEKHVLRVWDVTKRQQSDEVKLAAEVGKYGLEPLFSVKLGPFSPSGRFVMVSYGSTVFVWNITDRRVEWSWRSDKYISAYSPSPDWSRCAVGLKSGNVKVVSIADKEVVATLRGHESDTNCLAWHGDRWLASASHGDRRVRVWDVEKQNEIWQFFIEETANNVFFVGPKAICFDPKQQRLWTGAYSLRQYDVPPLARELWKVSTPKTEAVDFAALIKDCQLSVSSGMTSISARVTLSKYTFSDRSAGKVESRSGQEAMKFSFTAPDGTAALDATFGMSLDDDCGVVAVVPGSSAAASGLKIGDVVLASGDSQGGPFYRMPGGGTDSDRVLRVRLLAGRSASSGWFRVKDAGGSIRTISMSRDQRL